MVLRVTFDTNVLDLACRPERFPKDPRQPLLQKVHNALVNRQILGFYSVTMLTIEGIMRSDRAKIFAGTRTVMKEGASYITKNANLPDAVRKIVGESDLETIPIEMRVEQPDRKALHPEVIARMQAAKALGVKVLCGVPRIGAFHITDPTEEYYLSRGENADLNGWIDKAHGAANAIEARGVGFAQVKALGQDMGNTDPETIWFRSLNQANDVHKQRAVERAFSEWADGDSVAAHIAYGLDVFCSADVGKSSVNNSVLYSGNRAWITTIYGVRFMSFEELAASLS